MEDVLLKLWPYLERAGVFAGAVMTALYALQRRELVSERSISREDYRKYSEQLIADSRAHVAVIEKNTAAINSQSDMIRAQSELIRALISQQNNRRER